MDDLMFGGIAMKAVISEIPQHLLDERAAAGLDRWDEMWEGILHIPPMPNRVFFASLVIPSGRQKVGRGPSLQVDMPRHDRIVPHAFFDRLWKACEISIRQA